MRISLYKFGSVLTSRQSGKEAYAAFQPVLKSVADAELVEVNFEGVLAFSPSWGDEFLIPLEKRFGNRLTLFDSTNPSVQETLKTLQQISGVSFTIKK